MADRIVVDLAELQRVARDVALYHGGQRGLGRGALLLPPCETRAKDTLFAHARRAGLSSPARRDRVYVTTSRDAAIMFAVVHPSGGWAYRVEPIGEIEDDPDCDLPGLAYQVRRARIVQVIKPTSAQRREVMEAFR